ncbi:MAG TPA: response regulator [Thermodesulfobacteriota bacterium]|nr:response regulator [Thermodesulfobacteriota bacterium]
MRILVVDDNQGVATITQLILEMEGHEVTSALSGSEGYLAYLRLRPDLVITDIQMPGENGFEMMNHIRQQNPRVKAIYMSGNLLEFYADLETEKDHYPINFLDKPFSREELIGQVRQLLS